MMGQNNSIMTNTVSNNDAYRNNHTTSRGPTAFQTLSTFILYAMLLNMRYARHMICKIFLLSIYASLSHLFIRRRTFDLRFALHKSLGYYPVYLLTEVAQ